MVQFLQLLVAALAIGSIYAVIALSFEIAYEATGVVNFATGQLVVVGALVGASSLALTQASVGFGGSYLVMLAVMAVVGLAFFVTVFQPLRNKPAVTVVIGTVGIGIAIQNISQLVWGPLPARTASPAGTGVVHAFGTVVPLHALFVIGTTATLIVAVYLLMHHSFVGRQFRAVAQDSEAAKLMGIRVTWLYGFTWILVAGLAGVAGMLLSPMWFIDVNMGDSLALKAFAAAVIGGFGSIPGAICGGILVGAAEIFGASYVSSAYKDALVFALMILFLVVRPQGLFGERIGGARLMRALPWLVVMGAALLLPTLLPAYSLRVLDLAIIASIAVVGLCFAFGYAGLIHLAQAAFVGVGAYTTALLSTRLGFGFWSALPAALLMGAVVSVLIGAPMLRLRGHYLALATVGFNVTMEIVTKNWVSLTGGDDGISSIPGVSVAGYAISTDLRYYYLALVFLVVAALVGMAVRHSHFGRAMISVRDDELACRASSVDVVRTKLLAFTLCGVYGALSGTLYAHYAGYISPGDFDGVHALTLLVMLILGGEVSITGAIAGCVLVSFGPEWLRFVGQAYLTVFGLGIIAVLVLLPGGLAGLVSTLRTRYAPHRA